MKMTKPSYPGLFHYIHKAMADVEYPITKAALLEQIADRQGWWIGRRRHRCGALSNRSGATSLPAPRICIAR